MPPPVSQELPVAVFEGARWGVFAPGVDEPIVIAESRLLADRIADSLRSAQQPEKFDVIPVEVTIRCAHPRGQRSGR